MVVMLRLALACVVAMVASQAQAQTVERRWRLHAATSLAEYGVARERVGATQADTERGSLGPRRVVGLGAGFGLSESVVVGCALWLGYASDTQDSGGTAGHLLPSQTEAIRWTVKLSPYLEWIGSAATVRPFVGLSMDASVQHARRVPNVSFLDDDPTNHVQIGLSPAAGLHVFVAQSVTIDLAVRGSFAYQTTLESPTRSGTSYGIAALLGLSGWIR